MATTFADIQDILDALAAKNGQGGYVPLQTELENRELRLSYSKPERTSLDER